MANYSTPEQKQKLAGYVLSHGSNDSSSWNAPLKLINDNFGAAWIAQQGLHPEQAEYSPSQLQLATKVSFSPTILENAAELGSNSGNGTLNLTSTDMTQSKNTFIAFGDGFGGPWSPASLNNPVIGPDSLSEFDFHNDYALLFSTRTVAEARGTKKAVIPVPITGYDTQAVDWSALFGGTVNLPFGAGVSGIYCKGLAAGDLTTSGGGQIVVEPKPVVDYDSWLVLDMAQFYRRSRGDENPRVAVANPGEDRPRVYIKANAPGACKASKTKYSIPGSIPPTSTEWIKYSYGKAPMNQGLTQLTIPDTGNSYANNRLGHSQSCGVRYKDEPGGPPNFVTGQPMRLGVYNFNAPWVSGYYNAMRYQWIHESEGSEAKYLNKHVTTQPTSTTYYVLPCVNGSASDDFLRKTYGCQQLTFINPATQTWNNQKCNNGGIIAARQGQSLNDSTEVWLNLQPFLTTNNFRDTYLAFPDEESIVAFFADWGVLASTDLDEVLNGDNEDPGDDVPPGGGWGPWDPDSPGKDPWDNPTNPEDGDPPVPYDPDNPGVDPLEPEPPGISTATGSTSFVFTQEQVLAIEDWMMDDDFIKNASSLFVDKTSAVNSLTLFPFDVVTHDGAHVDSTASISIAKVSFAPGGPCYSITSGYNTWISGGSITFGEDWLAIRPDFTAFRNSSYSCYIPLVGMVDVPASAVIYRTLKLDYAVDMVSGAGTAVLRSYPAGNAQDHGAQDAGFIVAMFPCQVGLPVPLVSNNSAQRSYAVMMGTISGAINGATGGFSNGQNAAGAINKATAVPEVTNSAGFVTTKGVSGAAGAGSVAAGALMAGLAVVGAGIGAAKGYVDASIANPLEFSHVGSTGPMCAWTLGFTPYLTVTSQVPAFPADYEWVMGQQSSQRGYLYKFANNGYNYVECYATKLEIPGATSSEIALINAALQNGVYI